MYCLKPPMKEAPEGIEYMHYTCTCVLSLVVLQGAGVVVCADLLLMRSSS